MRWALAGSFERELKATAKIDDRHDAAAQVHHAVDERRRLGKPGDVVRRPRDLVHRRDGQAVFLIAQAEDDELLVSHGVPIRLAV